MFDMRDAQNRLVGRSCSSTFLAYSILKRWGFIYVEFAYANLPDRQFKGVIGCATQTHS